MLRWGLNQSTSNTKKTDPPYIKRTAEALASAVRFLFSGLLRRELVNNESRVGTQHPGIQYLLIIEGQASKDAYSQNYELSYKRAYSLKKFWEKGGIQFTDQNCEVLICGSGDGKQSGTGLMRETNEKLNQRFLIHILPKPGVIEKVTNQ